METNVACTNCGDVVDARRVQAGYDYCTKPECQERCLSRVKLVSVAVNKAADYVDRADDSVAATPLPAGLVGDGGGEDRGRRETSVRPAQKRPQATLERLRAAEEVLDARLGNAAERFSRGELTAAEMKVQQRRLVREFNTVVRAENIRYRSLLRTEP